MVKRDDLRKVMNVVGLGIAEVLAVIEELDELEEDPETRENLAFLSGHYVAMSRTSLSAGEFAQAIFGGGGSEKQSPENN